MVSRRIIIALITIAILFWIDSQFSEVGLYARFPYIKLLKYVLLVGVLLIGYAGLLLRQPWIKSLWLTTYLIAVTISLALGLVNNYLVLNNSALWSLRHDVTDFFLSPLPFGLFALLSGKMKKESQ